MTGLKMENIFTKHPRSINETYLQHFYYTTKCAVVMAIALILCLLHGIFPFLFKQTGSNLIIQLATKMSDRRKEFENKTNIKS